MSWFYYKPELEVGNMRTEQSRAHVWPHGGSPEPDRILAHLDTLRWDLGTADEM